MPTVSHRKTFEKRLTSDTYQITISCCAKLKEINPDWVVCPFCGDVIVIEELTETTEET